MSNKREVMQFRLSRECRVSSTFDGPVYQEDIDKLILYLQILRDVYPSQKGADESGPDTIAGDNSAS